MRFKNVNQLLSGSFIYGLGGVMNGLLSFIALPLIARYISPAEYGIISMLLMIGMVLTAIFSLGLGTSIGSSYFSKEQQGEKNAVIIDSFVILLASSIVLIVVGLWNAESIGKLLFQVPDYTYLIEISIMTVAVSLLVQPWRLKLQFEQRAKRYIFAAFGSSLISFSIILLFVAVLDKSVIGYLYALLIGQVITFAMFFLLGKNGMSYLPSKDNIWPLLVEGLPLVPSFIFIFVIQNVVRYPLQSYHGLDAVGIFTMGSSIGMAMGLVVEAFMRIWVPFSLAYMNKQEQARQLLARLTQYYLVVTGYITLLFFFFAKPVVMTFLPHSYENSYQIVGIIAASQFFLGFFTVLLPSIYFAKKLYATVVIQGVSAIISVGMYMIFIPKFGVTGAALSVMLGNALMALLLLVWIKIDHDCSKIDYEQRKIYKTLVCIAVLSQLPILLNSENWYQNVGYGIMCSVISGWVMLRMAGVTIKQLKQLMLQVVSKG